MQKLICWFGHRNTLGDLFSAVHEKFSGSRSFVLQDITTKEVVEPERRGGIGIHLDCCSRSTDLFQLECENVNRRAGWRGHHTQGLFQEVVRVLQNHEQHIAKNGAASVEMAQYINALINDNENKSLWIGTPVSESQTQILQQHQIGQQSLLK